jgi:micrococcal nuclease
MSRLLFALLSLAAMTSSAQVLTGKVVGIADGDTLTLLVDNQTYQIRLAEIDAPEKAQAFGQKSKALLSELCFKKAATASVTGTSYNRYVAKVDCDGIDVARLMVRNGLAWVYVKYAPRNSPLYALEAAARSERLGLWQDNEPTPPWAFRKAKKGQE